MKPRKWIGFFNGEALDGERGPLMQAIGVPPIQDGGTVLKSSRGVLEVIQNQTKPQHEWLLFVHLSKWEGLAEHASWCSSDFLSRGWVMLFSGAPQGISRDYDKAIDVTKVFQGRCFVLERSIDRMGASRSQAALVSFVQCWKDGKELEELAEVFERVNSHSGTPTIEALAALMVGFALSHDITELLLPPGNVNDDRTTAMKRICQSAALYKRETERVDWWKVGLGSDLIGLRLDLERELHDVGWASKNCAPILRLIGEIEGLGPIAEDTVRKAMSEVFGVWAR